MSEPKQHLFVEVNYIATLATVCGTHAAAARKMGITPSLVSKAISEGRAKLVNELAAKAILDDMTAPGIFDNMTPAQTMETLRDMIEAAKKKGLSNFRFDDQGTFRATVSMDL